MISNTNITQTDVKDILSSFIVNKASGPDGISHRILKKYLSYYKPLSMLSNISIQQQYILKFESQQLLCKFFKKGDKSDVGN